MENDLSIMYSGGLDSFIAYHYAKKLGYNPVCLWVNLGHDYADKELQSMESVKNQYPEFYPIVEVLNIKELVPLISKRLTNQIIPSRNLLLAVIGAMFSGRVWIHALESEVNGKERDKSFKFFDDSTNLLTYTNSFFQKQTIVESPFIAMTKAETIQWALSNGIPKEVLMATSTCYHPTEKKCGKCLTCYKRYTAFLLNGIDEPGYSFNPLETDYAREMKEQIEEAHNNKDRSRFTQKRIDEHFKLLDILKKG